jgi:hypothetical protein
MKSKLVFALFLFCAVFVAGCGDSEDFEELGQLEQAVSIGKAGGQTLGFRQPSGPKCSPWSGEAVCILPDPGDGYLIRYSQTQLNALDLSIAGDFDPETFGFFESRWFETAAYWESIGPFDLTNGAGTPQTFELVVNDSLAPNNITTNNLPLTSAVRVSCPISRQQSITELVQQPAAYKTCALLKVEIDVDTWANWVRLFAFTPAQKASRGRQLMAKIQGLLQGLGTSSGAAPLMGDELRRTTEPGASLLDGCLLNSYDPVLFGSTVLGIADVPCG